MRTPEENAKDSRFCFIVEEWLAITFSNEYCTLFIYSPRLVGAPLLRPPQEIQSENSLPG